MLGKEKRWAPRSGMVGVLDFDSHNTLSDASKPSHHLIINFWKFRKSAVGQFGAWTGAPKTK